MDQINPTNDRIGPPSAPPGGPGESTLVHVDLRPRSANGPGAPGAVQMLGDLVAATSGELRGSSSAGLSAAYASARQAVAAVRHMQRLVHGFTEAAASPAPGGVYASFTLRYADDAVVQPAATTSLPRPEAEPVLLLGRLCGDAGSIPGLQFKETNLARGGKVMELLPPAYPAAQARPSALPPPAPKASAAPAAARAGTPTDAPRAATASFSAVVRKPDDLPAPRNTRMIAILAGVAAVIVLIVVALVMRSSGKAKPETPIAATPASTAAGPSEPAAEKSGPPARLPETSGTPAAVTHTPATPAKPKSAATPAAPTPTTEGDKAAKEKETPPAPSGGPTLTFSNSEIAQMIAKADKLSGDGSYDRAILLYNTVLRQDRKNAQALAGLQRATRNQNHP
jgi:hypothetical protein